VVFSLGYLAWRRGKEKGKKRGQVGADEDEAAAWSREENEDGGRMSTRGAWWRRRARALSRTSLSTRGRIDKKKGDRKGMGQKKKELAGSGQRRRKEEGWAAGLGQKKGERRAQERFRVLSKEKEEKVLL
jgi:hypothetical protein